MTKQHKNVEVNEFDETIAASKSFFEKHGRTLLYGGGTVLALIIVALLAHQFYFVPRSKNADKSIFYAQQLYLDGNYEKALNGEGEKLGFLAVAEQYGSTDAGNLARLYAAMCYYQTEKYQEAVDMLEKYDDCGDAMVSPAAIGMLGNCYAELGNNEKAADLLMKAAQKANNNTLSPGFLIQAGQIYEQLGNNEKALDCYKRIKAAYQQSMQYAEIDKYIERISNK